MATNTYTALVSTTLSSSASSVNLSLTGITGYTDLVVVSSPLAATGGTSDYGIYLRFNGDSTSGLYSETFLYGNGSSAVSTRHSSANQIIAQLAGYISNTQPQANIWNIQNYANTTTHKTVIGRSNNISSSTESFVGLWRNTAAITSVQVVTTVGSFGTGSTFTVYGIAAAVTPTAKATGGTITYGMDGYTYHTFTSSGTFTPSQSLSCDYMVVAGGGGNAYRFGGGGGAGGLTSATAQSLTTTGYTVTVGAGGPENTNGSDSVFNALTAVGGGYGGGTNYASGVSGNGGSGGGGYGYTPGIGGTGISGQGFAGGNGATNYRNGGGGGGAGAVGELAISSYGGNGGIGSSAFSSWLATTGKGQAVSGTYYIAGGGGGGCNLGNGGDPSWTGHGLGGAGGGGNGGAGATGGAADNLQTGTAGTVNTGGGAGGNSQATGALSGGSGIVIIRYAS